MKNQAFSLVELSIVLVILGLLTGGILAGQSLIHAAQLRSVTVEYNRYYTAIRSFRDKYFALPGDMNNAVAFWGAADGSTGNTAACATTQGTGTQTCNGNGDNIIATSTSSAEQARFWQHLANAGLIEGNFTGILDATYTVVATKTSPPSKLDNNLWWVNNPGTQSGSASLFDGVYNNQIFIIGPHTSTTWTSSIAPADAWNIDTKMDDGMPGTGGVVGPWSNAYNPTGANCTTAASSAAITATYNLSVSDKSCAIFWRNLF